MALMVPDQIEQEVVVEAPVERVWAVLTEAEHIGTWFGDSAEIDLRPGGELIVSWDEHGSYPAVVVKVEPPTFFSFRWARPAGAKPREGNSTLVEFTLSAEGERTRLRVVESGFPSLEGSEQENRRVRRGQHRRVGRPSSMSCASTRRRSRCDAGRAAGRALGGSCRSDAPPAARPAPGTRQRHGDDPRRGAAGVPAGRRQAPRGPRPGRPRRRRAAGPRGALHGPARAARGRTTPARGRRRRMGRPTGRDQAPRGSAGDAP